MRRLLNVIGMMIGGWIGWELGILISLFTAFIIGMIGTGAGLFAAQRLSKHLLP